MLLAGSVASAAPKAIDAREPTVMHSELAQLEDFAERMDEGRKSQDSEALVALDTELAFMLRQEWSRVLRTQRGQRAEASNEAAGADAQANARVREIAMDFEALYGRLEARSVERKEALLKELIEVFQTEFIEKATAQRDSP
jgi:hypothetical protein